MHNIYRQVYELKTTYNLTFYILTILLWLVSSMYMGSYVIPTIVFLAWTALSPYLAYIYRRDTINKYKTDIINALNLYHTGDCIDISYITDKVDNDIVRETILEEILHSAENRFK